MNESGELFIRGSKRFYEGLDRVLASVDEPDEQWVHQTFNCPKWQLEKVDELVKSGDMDLGVAEERRFRIEKNAWPEVYGRVLNSWDTRDKLDEEFARYRRAVSGEELQHLEIEEDNRRKVALREFDDVWLEIHTWHSGCLLGRTTAVQP
ncbi:MAG TPA: hypothetical protein VN956_12375 [Pyrinomonadaceae bacterium]|nr:hypothetical protein [Pyrinomonadaceae bacterium]